MTRRLDALTWPAARLGEALEALARGQGLAPRSAKLPMPAQSAAQDGAGALGAWIEAAAAWLGIEAEPAGMAYADAGDLVGVAPAIMRISGGSEPRFLALVGATRSTVRLLAPDSSVHRVAAAEARAALCGPLESRFEAAVEAVLREAGVSGRRAERARSALLSARLNAERIGEYWTLRLPPGASFRRQARQAGLPRRLALLGALHTLQYGLWLASWWLVGRGALEGRLDRGWLIAWALMLLTLVPLRLLETWQTGVFALGAGGLLKQRLLWGALRLEPEEIRYRGAGQLLGCVLESDAVESLALSGGFLGLVSAIELAAAAAVLASGAGRWPHAALLAGWVALTLGLAVTYTRRRRRWTESRLAMTDQLVEKMVGHRTRLAQEPRSNWHEGEDEALERYLGLSRATDRAAALLMAFIPRGWLIVGIAGIAPAFVSGAASQASLALGLGGILLAQRALEKLAAGLWNLAGARIAWKQVASLFDAVARPATPGLPEFAVPQPAAAAGRRTVIEAEQVTFRYRERGEPVLRGCGLRIESGERCLVEGPSGGGKSTLASLLVGLRVPESGLLLLDGLDRHTLGAEGWRRRVVAAPQFHENHVLTGTFAFNLLMGRRWPPEASDFEEAEALCRELGLGELLGRMPAGLLQMVGETGWQLSHGERSRLYIARALLQKAELVVLDESFAALDPETLRRALRCVLDRAPTLVVIAHP